MILRNGTLLVLTSILVACGGDESKDSLSINKNFETSSDEPSLTAVSATEGLTVLNNSEITGSLEEGESVTFQFAADPEGYVSVIALNSEAPNFDLEVAAVGSNTPFIGNNFTSFESTMVSAGQFSDYLITVKAQEGSGDFSLKVATANRTSLGLSENEYFFDVESEGRADCISGSYLYVDYGHMILNFEDEYAVIDGVKTEFTHTKGSTVFVYQSEAYVTEELGLSELDAPKYKEYEFELKDGYRISGTLNWTSFNSSDNNRCTAEVGFSGYAIL